MSARGDSILLKLRLNGERAVEAGLDRVARSARGVGSAVGSSNMVFRGAGRGLLSLTSAARVGAITLGGAAVGGLAYAAKETYSELNRIERIGAQTMAVIRSTGNAARSTAADSLALADRLESVTSVESEAIQEGQNLLRTFTRVQNGVGRGNKVFDRATRAIVDMSVAMGTDQRTAALQVGRALNDPIRGLTALGRVGIQFSDQQRERIRQYVEEGRVAKAQGVILGELERQFGGSGRALGNTRSGRLAILGHRWGQIQEGLLAPTLPMLDRLLDTAEPLATRFADRVNGAMSRRRLAFGDKVRLVWRGTREDLDPYLDDVQRWIDEAQLGDRLADGVERATPVILDAAAGAAGRAGETFVKAWIATGPWGKLLTVGFLMTKLRAWGPAARLSARLFGSAWRRTMGESTAFTDGGRQAGRQAGAAASASAAGTSAATIGPEVSARKRAWRRAGSIIGKTMGVAAGAALAAWAWEEAMGALGESIEGLGEGGAADSDSLVQRTRERMNDPNMPARIAAWARANPEVARRFRNRRSASLSDDLLADLVRTGYPGLTPGATNVPRDYRGAFPQVTRRPPRRARAGRAEGVETTPMRRGRRDLHVGVNIDGRQVGRAAVRNVDDDDQWER